MQKFAVVALCALASAVGFGSSETDRSAKSGAVTMPAGSVELDSIWKIVAPKHGAAAVAYGYDRAAELLKKDLAEGAGLKLEIVKEAPKEGHAICLGADLAKAAGVKTDDLAWYDNAIVEKGGARDYLWSPNLDKRSLDNAEAMGRIVFE